MSEGHNEVIIRIYEEVTITVCRIWGTGKQQWPTWSWQPPRILTETGKELPKMRIHLCCFVYYMLVYYNVLLLLRFYPIAHAQSSHTRPSCALSCEMGTKDPNKLMIMMMTMCVLKDLKSLPFAALSTWQCCWGTSGWFNALQLSSTRSTGPLTSPMGRGWWV